MPKGVTPLSFFSNSSPQMPALMEMGGAKSAKGNNLCWSYAGSGL